jgi:hypothetical protein
MEHHVSEVGAALADQGTGSRQQLLSLSPLPHLFIHRYWDIAPLLSTGGASDRHLQHLSFGTEV